jgi:hypothetical protein
VLRHKRAAVAPDASPDQKQVYADSVRAFVVKHPNHSRATEVWQRLQLEFADDLAGVGRYQDAIRIYRSVLTHHPENDHARGGMALAAARLAITREGLLALRKGMSHHQVSSLLGKPIPGWTVKNRRAWRDLRGLVLPDALRGRWPASTSAMEKSWPRKRLRTNGWQGSDLEIGLSPSALHLEVSNRFTDKRTTCPSTSIDVASARSVTRSSSDSRTRR